MSQSEPLPPHNNKTPRITENLRFERQNLQQFPPQLKGEPATFSPALALALSSILNNTVRAIRQFLGVDRANIFCIHSNGSGVAIAESIAENSLPALLGSSLPAEELKQWDGEGELKNGKSLLRQGVCAALSLPIAIDRQQWGLLAIYHSQARPFEAREVKLLEAWLEQLAVAIAQNQLLLAAREQEYHEAIAARISSILNASQPFPQRKQAAIEEIANALGCDGARLYIAPDASNRAAELFVTGDRPNLPYVEETPFWQKLFLTTASVAADDCWESCPIPLDSRPLEAKVCAIPDLYTDPRIAPLKSAFQTTQIRSLLIVPLRSYQRCVGCLTLFRRNIETEQLARQQQLLTRLPYPENGSPWPWSKAEIKLACTLGAQFYAAVMEYRLEETIDHHCNHDRLTGLATRMLFCDRLSLALKELDSQSPSLLAVFFLDLDGFKTINDTLGHDIGDRLLQYVGNRLVSCLQSGDLVARWGGDEFTILLHGIHSAEKATAIARKLLAALSVPFPFNGKNLYVKASLGIALAPDHGTDADTLLKHADAALYRAKQQGRNTYQIYHAAIGNTAKKRLQLEHNLYLALERQEFELYYQPQISLSTGKIVAMEALVRWVSPELGPVSPSKFIPLAEEMGLIGLIGEWVFQEACFQSKAWQALNLRPIPIAVNLSGRQFEDKRLLGIVTRILEETGSNPQQLELEITESIAMKDIDFTVSVLQNLRELGIKIALDDFGTGYSSLATLKSFPLDSLKIDRSFVRDLTKDSRDEAIISAFVALGNGLGLQTVAEGIEQEEQSLFLKQVGCNLAQGYFFSYPLPAPEATQLLTNDCNPLS